MQSLWPGVDVESLPIIQRGVTKMIIWDQEQLVRRLGSIGLRNQVNMQYLYDEIIRVETGRILYHVLYGSQRDIYLSPERQRILHAMLMPLWHGDDRLFDGADVAHDASVAVQTLHNYTADLGTYLPGSGYEVDVYRRPPYGTLSYRLRFASVMQGESPVPVSANGHPKGSSSNGSAGSISPLTPGRRASPGPKSTRRSPRSQTRDK